MKIFTWVLLLISACLCPVPAHAQSWQSALAVSAVGGSATVSDIVADGAGGYVAAGNFTGTIVLGSFTLTNASGDIFVARLSAAGQWTQAVNMGGTGTQTVGALALDRNGGVVVAGTFNGATATIGSVTLSQGNGNIFVARLSAAGQWTQAAQAGYSSTATNGVTGLVVNPTNGTVTVVGSFSGSTGTFGSHRLVSSVGGYALFAARLDASGTWTQAVGTTYANTPSHIWDVALDAAGNAVVCGFFQRGTAQFGSTTLVSGATTAFVARLSVAGTWTQAVQANSNGGFADVYRVAVDANDDVVIAGDFRDADVSFGSYTLPYTASTLPINALRANLFVARLSSAGVWTQAAQAANSGNSLPRGMSLGADGSVWVAGWYQSPTISFGTTTLTNATPTAVPPSNVPTADVFVACLSPAGSWTYAAQAGGLGNDYPTAVLLDGSRLLVTGTFGPASTSFGSLTLTTPTNTAGFIAGLEGIPIPASTAPLASLDLAPNPASTSTRLTLPGSSAAARTVLVLDALGREVHRQEVSANTSTIYLPLAGLSQGLYVVRCGEATGRLLVE